MNNKRTIFLYLFSAMFINFAGGMEESQSSTPEPLPKTFLYQLDIEPSTSQPRPPVYLLGTYHDLPHTFLRDEIKDKLKQSQIQVQETAMESNSFDCDELLEFDSISLSTLREEGLVMPSNQDWLSHHLTFEQRQLLTEKFEADVKRRWDLSLAEVSPAVYYYCLQRIIGQCKSLGQSTAATEGKADSSTTVVCDNAAEEKNDNPTTAISHNAEEIAPLPALSTYKPCTVESYFIPSTGSTSSLINEENYIGLEDTAIRLKYIYKIDTISQQSIDVNIEKLKRCLDLMLLVKNNADLSTVEDAYAKLWLDQVVIFYNPFAEPCEFTLDFVANLSQKMEGYKNDLLTALLEEDIQKLSPMASESVVKRNQIWVPRIKQILKQKPDNSILIIVGATHLAGQNSLTRLLQAEGYNFSPAEERVFNIEPSNIEILRDVLSIKSQ